MAAPETPTKTCVLSDICVLCGFSFTHYEKKEDGKVQINKFFERKLKLTKERKDNVFQITGTNFSTNSAVCVKCYRSVESVIKSEEKTASLKARICDMAHNVKVANLQLPSPRKTVVTKRQLRSPTVSQSAKKDRGLNMLNVAAIQYRAVKIAPFLDITNQACSGEQAHPKIVRRSLEYPADADTGHQFPLPQGEIEVSTC